ncbi:RraA family protein [Streptomyces sp. SDT5-1]|uniref:RraA family protein n=1 Tax=Streptomyces sp. SDT5-1 TaxID=3406418 RepID=UPI003FD1EE6C
MTRNNSTSNADSTLLTQFAGLDTAAVSDALEGLGLPPGQGGITPMWGRPRVTGIARTVQLAPLDREHGGAHILTSEIAQAGPTDVLVIANDGRTDVSSWGGILSLGASAQGVRGVLTDGACRDVHQARELGFPVYARGQVPRTARGRLMQKSAGEPILFGTVTVHPGDVVVADENGICVVPSARAAEVLRAAHKVQEREAAIEAEIRAGAALTDAMRDARLAGEEDNM